MWQKNLLLFGGNATEDEFAEAVDQTASRRNNKILLPLLQERHPVYQGKSAPAVVRMRGYLLLHLAKTTVPDAAVPFIYEELENSLEAYLVGAAAKALRNIKKPSRVIAMYLIKAIKNMQYNDKAISFGSYFPVWPAVTSTSAIAELLESVSWLGVLASPIKDELKKIAENQDRVLPDKTVASLVAIIDRLQTFPFTAHGFCCTPAEHFTGNKNRWPDNRIALKNEAGKTMLEDHNGQKILWGDYCKKRYTLAAFFYTRCDNPLKCSLTIANMGRIQKLAVETGLAELLQFAAISYDQAYDLPYRMKIFGESRGFDLGQNASMLRVVNGPSQLHDYFEINVNYAGNVVNRHAVELRLLDRAGNIVLHFTRLQLESQHVFNQVKKYIVGQKNPVRAGITLAGIAIKNIWSVVAPVFMLFLPKCPFCFAAYLSFLGVSAAQVAPFMQFLVPAIAIIVGINVWALARVAQKRHFFIPVYLSIAGAVIILAIGYFCHFRPAIYTGIFLVFLGSVLNSLSLNAVARIKERITSISFKLRTAAR